MGYGNITDVPGIKVGNCENRKALTGCTVILTEEGATAGVDVRGSAPGTKETDLLDPLNTVSVVHGICLSGGSAFGLDAASGVMQYLEEKGFGLPVGAARVPIVPAATLFVLPVGNGAVRPDKTMGYTAAKSAITGSFLEGNFGAGCGATVGKFLGLEACMKGGLGTASMVLEDGLTVGAVVAVNAVGEVRDFSTGDWLAGAYNRQTGSKVRSLDFLKNQSSQNIVPGANTTIGVVAVNADFTKSEMSKIAQMAHNGLARTIFPVHTTQDGDTLFALATGGVQASVDRIGSLCAEVMAMAVVRAVKAAEGVLDIPAYKDIQDS
ncbi:P1 family peptidase [Camelliibacillus cellulosilyticus]|uniref:P1 family peptidase n=1 Tax=Camelliibacillus cellulosilyticus TaxID=2174486 RepID=A0ABV9GR60_9BACL